MNKPSPKNLSHHYSDTTKARFPSKMEEYYKYLQVPGMGNLAGGYPNPCFFPFDTLEAEIALPERWTPTPNRPDENEVEIFSQIKSAPVKNPTAASHIVVPHDTGAKDPSNKLDLTSALQYGHIQGYPPLLSFIRQFTRNCLHPNVPYKDGPEVIFTVGSTDGNSKVLELFTSIWIKGKNDVRERPGMLCDTFMYANVLKQAIPRGVQIVPVEMDGHGTAAYGPGGLEHILANWDESKGKRPHLLYTVTMGHNPTGLVISLERKKEIYAICSKYDVIIVEDDPYWYLQYPSAEIEQAKARGSPTPAPKLTNTLEIKSGYPFLDSLVPSFLNIDTDGRVIRLDTFSKIIAPGCRLGWITATPEVCEQVLRITESGTLQPSGFVQSVIAEAVMGSQASTAVLRHSAKDKLTFTGWQMDGWVRWLAGLRGEYERRMNRTCSILEEGSWQLEQSTSVKEEEAGRVVITKTQLYDFEWPRGGMSVWLHMRFERHPLWRTMGSKGSVIDGTVLCIAMLVYLTRKPNLVLVSPGMGFSATEKIRTERGWAYCRLCFAAEAEENIDKCSVRFVQGVQKFWRIKQVEELEDILSEINGGGRHKNSHTSEELNGTLEIRT